MTDAVVQLADDLPTRGAAAPLQLDSQTVFLWGVASGAERGGTGPRAEISHGHGIAALPEYHKPLDTREAADLVNIPIAIISNMVLTVVLVGGAWEGVYVDVHSGIAMGRDAERVIQLEYSLVCEVGCQKLVRSWQELNCRLPSSLSPHPTPPSNTLQGPVLQLSLSLSEDFLQWV